MLAQRLNVRGLNSCMTYALDVLHTRAVGYHASASDCSGAINDGGSINDGPLIDNKIGPMDALAEMPLIGEYKPRIWHNSHTDLQAAMPSRWQRRPPAISAAF